mmetsp:Transcript_13407/g.36754  ORF Transcript_13407/g.36754 Transcript_13407/m.36754 type:complete len:191 (+) Transcript_13407:45-617(+)
MPLNQYQVTGRSVPTKADPCPQIYRMRLFAPNEVLAKSRFWYFMRQADKMKRRQGEVLAVNQIRERSTRTVKNYGVTLRYISRSGTHNMYKEFRDTNLCAAVEQMYQELAGRHRVRWSGIHIVDAIEVPAGVRASKRAAEGETVPAVRRSHTKQMLGGNVRFPLAHRLPRASKKAFKTTFKANRPTTFFS